MEYSVENQQRKFETGEKIEMTVKDAYDSLHRSVLLQNSNFYLDNDTRMYFGLIKIEKSNLMPTDHSALNILNKMYKLIFNSKYNDDGPGHTYIPGNTRVVFFPTTRVNRIDDDDDDDIEQSTNSQQVGGRRKRKSNRRKSNKRKSNKRRSQKRRGSRRK
jgi:hypothetical protein